MSIYNLESASKEITDIKVSFNSHQYISHIKRNVDLSNWINEYVHQKLPNNNLILPAKLFLVLNPNFIIICPYGNIRKWLPTNKTFVCKISCKCSKEKKIETTKQHYGVNNPSQSNIIKEKRSKTISLKYGVTNAFQATICREQIKKTNLEKFGYENPMKNTKVKNKVKTTMIEKYGFEFYTQRNMSDHTLSILKNKDLFASMLQQYGVKEICAKLKISPTTISTFHTKYNLSILKPTPNTSSYENEIEKFLKSIRVTFIRNDYNVIKPKELDFFFPKHKFAIEFHGDFWHMNPKIYSVNAINPITKLTTSQHMKKDAIKLQICSERSIKLFTIWETDWNNNKEQIKNSLICDLNDRYLLRAKTV